MHLICLCPTFGRPSLVANALALFERQRLPVEHSAYLLIYDDSGVLDDQVGGSRQLAWRVLGRDTWEPLQRKYDTMLAACGFAESGRDDSAVVVWDDDDVYLPWHLAAHAAVLAQHRWSHPSRAWSTYGVDPTSEPPNEKRLSGRHYHGALAIRGDLMRELGGWPDTDRSDYDKQQLSRCWQAAGPPGDPCEAYPPSYVYRWTDTGHDHCSARIRDGRYQRPRIEEPDWTGRLVPRLDRSATAICARLNGVTA